MMTGEKVDAGRSLPSRCHLKIAPACIFSAISCTANGTAAAESPGLTTTGILGTTAPARAESRAESGRTESGVIATVGWPECGTHGWPCAASVAQFGSFRQNGVPPANGRYASHAAMV